MEERKLSDGEVGTACVARAMDHLENRRGTEAFSAEAETNSGVEPKFG
jgi:hypothetical protein